MLIMFLVVLGTFSFMDLGVDLFPKSDTAQVNILLGLPGTGPEEMVSQVVFPVEEAISSVSGIEELTAMVNEGNARINVSFVLDRDINEAVDDVREKVSGVLRRLPQNMLPPIVQKAQVDQEPVVSLAISGPRSIRELTEIADKQVRRGLETVDGVAAVNIQGGRSRQINLFLDINKMNGYNMTAQEVSRAIQTENIESPGGRVVRGPSELGVRTLGRVTSLNEFNDIIIKNVGGVPVRFRDIGFAEDGMTEKRGYAYVNNTPAVMLEIQRQTGVNTVKVVDDVLARLESLRGSFPAGVKVDVIREQATYIRNSVEALEEHLVLGSFLASIIVFIFIRDWRTVLISSLAIPTSIIATFTVLRMLDFTLNSMTLLGLTLAVGIVIDDAIIVLENIYRYINEKDLPPKQAAIIATKEIALAVMATTISLVIIFIPIAFMNGYARRFLNQFGWTMAISIIVSMLVAFTLTPTLSARLLKRTKGAHKAHDLDHPNFLERIYLGALDWSLSHRWVIITICVGVLSSTYWLNDMIGRDWMPPEDQSELNMQIETPVGSSIAFNETQAKAVAKTIAQVPGVRMTIPRTMGNFPNIGILLDPPDKRAPIGEMGTLVRAAALRGHPTLRPRVSFPNILGGRDSFSPIRAQILGPDMKEIVNIAKASVKEIEANVPAVADVRANLSLSNPEIQVVVDRPVASDLGVRIADISSTVRLFMSGDDQISTYKEGQEQYPVTMRLMPGQRDDNGVLSRLLVPSAKLGLIRLDSIARLERAQGPGNISRYNRQFSIGLFGNVAEGRSLDEAAAGTKAAIESVGLPPGYRVVFSGQVRILEETTRNMLLAMGLASIFMYMVLAAQFESLIHPFIIISTLPLSIPFALLSLIATDRTLNLFSGLGILLLLGIVKKNGILQIDCMNQLREQGIPLRRAIMEANRIRLRPILMTTLSIVAGLIPTAIATGSGASQRSAIAVTIIGGQMLCLILTLLVVPVGYSLVETAREWIAKRRGTSTEAHAVGD